MSCGHDAGVFGEAEWHGGNVGVVLIDVGDITSVMMRGCEAK